jgi:hypothetical protein
MEEGERQLMFKDSFTDAQYNEKAEEIKNRLNTILKEYSSKGYMPILKVKEKSGVIDEIDLANKYLRGGVDMTEDGKPIFLDSPTYEKMP